MQQTNVTISFVSALGSLFVLLCYYYFHSLRTFAFRLVMLMTVCDLCLSLANLLGDQGGNEVGVCAHALCSVPIATLYTCTLHSPNLYARLVCLQETHLSASPEMCGVQAVMIQFFSFASLMWSGAIAFTMYMSFLREDARFQHDTIAETWPFYHVTVWSVSLFISLLPLLTQSYGDTGGWCWIIASADEHGGTIWRFVCFYIPLCVVFTFSALTFWKVRSRLNAVLTVEREARARQQQEQAAQFGVQADDDAAVELTEDETKISTMISRMRFYPLVLVGCYTFSFINAVYESTTDVGTQSVTLTWLTIVTASSLGLCNAIVYGLTPAIKSTLMYNVCKQQC
jgi:hypothetical protein